MIYVPTRNDLIAFQNGTLDDSSLLGEAVYTYKQNIITLETVRAFGRKDQRCGISTKGLKVYEEYLFAGVAGMPTWKREMLEPAKEKYKYYSDIFERLTRTSDNPKERMRNILALEVLDAVYDLETFAWQRFIEETAKHTGNLVERDEIVNAMRANFRNHRAELQREQGVRVSPDLGKAVEEYYLNSIR